nr:EOG090X0F7H [Sida crystallina]
MENSSINGNGISSGHSTLSRNPADKALVKRNVHRALLDQLNLSNSQEESRAKKPLRNPRGYCFWATVFALCLIAIANFFLTVTIFSVLRLTKSMEHVEVLPAINSIKFFGETNFESIIKSDGKISGYSESPVEITGHGSGLTFKVLNDQEPDISPILDIGLNTVEFLNVNRFDILEPKKWVKSNAFSTMFPNFGLPKGVQSLHIKKASASRIVSRLEGSLTLQSDSHMRVRGNEGVTIQGRELIFSADQDLLLRSINGSVTLDGTSSIVFDTDRLTVVPTTSHDESSSANRPVAQYKLCICMPQGTLFRIPILQGTDTIHCDSIDVSGDENPCSI